MATRTPIAITEANTTKAPQCPTTLRKRKCQQGADGATALFHQLDIGHQGDRSGEEMEQGERADEGGDASDHQATRPLTGLADDQGEPDTGQGQRHGKTPDSEQEQASALDPLPYRAGLVHECQHDEDGEDDESEPPDIIGLATKSVPHVVT